MNPLFPSSRLKYYTKSGSASGWGTENKKRRKRERGRKMRRKREERGRKEKGRKKSRGRLPLPFIGFLLYKKILREK